MVSWPAPRVYKQPGLSFGQIAVPSRPNEHQNGPWSRQQDQGRAVGRILVCLGELSVGSSLWLEIGKHLCIVLGLWRLLRLFEVWVEQG